LFSGKTCHNSRGSLGHDSRFGSPRSPWQRAGQNREGPRNLRRKRSRNLHRSYSSSHSRPERTRKRVRTLELERSSRTFDFSLNKQRLNIWKETMFHSAKNQVISDAQMKHTKLRTLYFRTLKNVFFVSLADFGVDFHISCTIREYNFSCLFFSFCLFVNFVCWSYQFLFGCNLKVTVWFY
jgi:hypothetical protein